MAGTDNEKEKLSKLKAIAKEADQAAVSAFKDLEQRQWTLAAKCIEIRDKQLFQYLGFQTFDDWRKDRKIGRSTVYRLMRIFEKLENIMPAKEIHKLTAANADVLCTLPIDNIKAELIEQAQTLKEHELIPKVEKIKARIQRAAAAKSVSTDGVQAITEEPELRVTFKKYVYASQRDLIENTMADVDKDNDLKDNPGRSLEIICAGYLASRLNDAQQVISWITPDLGKLNAQMTEAIDVIEHSELSAEETLGDAKRRIDDMQKSLFKSLQSILRPETIVKKLKAQA